MKNFAYLREDSPFHSLFPNGIPIKNILMAELAVCEGDGDAQAVYMVDLDQIGRDQLDRLVAQVREQCDPTIPLELARKEMMARGLPLRAKHVKTVSSDLPFFL